MTEIWDTSYWASDPLKSAAGTWSAIATLFAVLISIIAALFAWLQFKHARNLQNEAFAKSIYAEQLRLDLLYPQFSVPNYWELKRDNKLPHYDTFLSHLLWAMDEILLYSKDRTWPDVFKGYLAFHYRYLARPEFDFGTGVYSTELVDIIREASTNHRNWLDSEPLAVFDEWEADAERDRARALKRTGRTARSRNVKNG